MPRSFTANGTPCNHPRRGPSAPASAISAARGQAHGTGSARPRYWHAPRPRNGFGAPDKLGAQGGNSPPSAALRSGQRRAGAITPRTILAPDLPPMTQAATTAPPRPLPRFAEFVMLMAALMALTALSIDVMLPALPQMRAEFGITDANRQQLVLTSYVVGFAVGQLFHGPRATGSAASRCSPSASLFALASFLCSPPTASRRCSPPASCRACLRRPARRRGGGGARHLRRAAHGRGHVLRDDGLHRGAGGRADPSAAASSSSAPGT